MLELVDVTAGYGGKTVLRNVHLRMDPGRILALIGPNGAGKSTVIKAIAGIAEVTGGNLRFEGADLRRMRPSALVTSGIAYLNQGKIIFENLTVLENLQVAREAAPQRAGSIETMMRRFPMLSIKARQNASSLSGGERQQLALARALLSRPRMIMMDEPSLGLSPRLMTELFDAIRLLAEEGTAVLLVEQNARQAIRVAHHTVLLTDGTVALSGGPEILNDERIRRIYLGG